jgi:ribosomal protein S18 acetylase RimI-like enzyme
VVGITRPGPADPQRAQWCPVIPDESRFETDPTAVVGAQPTPLPDGWEVGSPDPDDRADVARLTALLRAHEEHGRGWPGSGVDAVLVEVSDHGLRTRENVVVRDSDGVIQAWGSAHDRAGGRMLYVHIVARDIDPTAADACSDVLVEWAVGQARTVGAARGLAVQQIDTGAFADDDRQHAMLGRAGFERVRSWWQMRRPVTEDERQLVPDPVEWDKNGVRFRLVRRGPDGMPDEDDLREVHEVLESAFVDHFNSHPETFEEFVHRLREDPGHTWDHWWVAELLEEDAAEVVPAAVGTLIATESVAGDGPPSSYIDYLGVLSSARGRGVAKGLLTTAIADAALRGRPTIGIEVDADSPTGANDLYVAMGWKTRYTTESWHLDVPVDG